MLKLFHMTDLHLCLTADDSKPSQTALAQSGSIIDACLEAFLSEPDCPILLLGGDLTQSGQPEEHAQMIQKLQRVQAAGKRVIAITASHDCRSMGHERSGELRQMYAAFGLQDAISSFDNGLAFVVQLQPDLRLLCVHDHGREAPPPWLPWALEQVRRAKAAGACIFGMAHLPSQPPTPVYALLDRKSMLPGFRETTRALANAGLPFFLTGHSHIHNIAPITTPEGSPFWDINTSSLIGFPGKLRVLELEAGNVQITSRTIPQIPAFGDTDAQAFLKEKFVRVFRDLFDGLDHDFDLFARSAGLGIHPAVFYEKKRLIVPAGKIIARITLGGVARLLACRIPKEVQTLRLRDVLTDAIANVYAGQEPYGPETPLGKAFLAYGRRLRFLEKKLGIADAPAFLLSLVYDPTPDDTVAISL